MEGAPIVASNIFSGTSRYASDFTQIIDRAVGIASLPLSQLNNQKNALTAKATALTAVNSQFTNLKAAIENLGQSLTQKSLLTKTSDETVVKPTVQSGALPGVHEIEVISPGTYTQTLSGDALARVADPYSESITAATSLTLTVDGVATTITLENADLASLAKAINSSGGGVAANIVNIGGNDAPDYRLSLRSTQLGPVTISLSDGAQETVDTLSAGTLASYRVDGLPATPITSTSRNVTVALGLSVEIKKAGTTEVEIEQNADSIQESITALITAYNATVAELDKHRGKANGALQGEPVLSTLNDELRQLRSFVATTTGVDALDDLGIEVDRNGLMHLDTVKFQEANAGGMQPMLSFLGSATGGGFLQAATEMLEKLQNSTDGVLFTAKDGFEKQITHQDELIAENEDRIALMRESLMARMAVADALIASLEQQVTVFTGIFEAQSNANNR